MIITLDKKCAEGAKKNIEHQLSLMELSFNKVKTQFNEYYVVLPKKEFDIRFFGQLEGVEDVHRVTDAYKLVSRQRMVGRSVVTLGNLTIGAGDFTMMAGPCSIESEEQIEVVSDLLVEQGVKIMRGGVFKPRSSPYAFRGLGIEGLKTFYDICRRKGIKIITEVMQVSQIEEMHDYVDIFQVGARNTQNFNLLDALGTIDKAVLLKRGIAGSIDELLQSAEYVFSAGNERLMLCERGIRTFEKAYRNTFDINAIPILKEKSHLPVIADTSHGIGIRKHVSDITLAAQIAGADGAIIEVHPVPEKAFSDGQQSLYFDEFATLMKKVRQLEAVCKAW